ncbi:hypothetical protein Bhyg_13413 [Pseudolycoriella hygida]|uniref:Uncharacterized protein n=1 Tax=Pseudolycoriella hygida TaxID=35572 RepID=A0A9Q0MMS9_9DIPT|nr:hypothetical protein Bhyg_13413 [Pseudolycoriella hygida]
MRQRSSVINNSKSKKQLVNELKRSLHLDMNVNFPSANVTVWKFGLLLKLLEMDRTALKQK